MVGEGHERLRSGLATALDDDQCWGVSLVLLATRLESMAAYSVSGPGIGGVWLVEGDVVDNLDMSARQIAEQCPLGVAVDWRYLMHWTPRDVETLVRTHAAERPIANVARRRLRRRLASAT